MSNCIGFDGVFITVESCFPKQFFFFRPANVATTMLFTYGKGSIRSPTPCHASKACKRMILCSSTELGCLKDCILSRVTLEDYSTRTSEG